MAVSINRVREAFRANAPDCFREARTVLPVWDRALLWADVLMEEMSGATAPIPVQDIYGRALLQWGIPKKTCQRALDHQQQATGDCLIRKRMRFKGVSGSVVLIWSRSQWKRFKTATWQSSSPRSPGHLRDYLMRKAARKTKAPVDPFPVAYTCAVCGRPGFKKWRKSTRKTCSSTCRKKLQRMSHTYWTPCHTHLVDTCYSDLKDTCHTHLVDCPVGV